MTGLRSSMSGRRPTTVCAPITDAHAHAHAHAPPHTHTHHRTRTRGHKDTAQTLRGSTVHLRPPEVAPASGYGHYPDTPCRRCVVCCVRCVLRDHNVRWCVCVCGAAPHRWDSRYAYANSGISFAVSCTRTGLRTKSLTSKQIAQHVPPLPSTPHVPRQPLLTSAYGLAPRPTQCGDSLVEGE